MPAVTIQIVGVDALKGRFTSMRQAWAAAPRSIVNQAAQVLKKALQQEAPVRTGALRRGIRFRTQASGGAVIARFTSEAAYTPFVIQGTKPHEIWAGFYTGRSSKRVLAWSGADHPTPYVQHPGTRANDFPVRAMRKAGPLVRAILARTGQALVSDDPMAAVFWDTGGADQAA